MNGKGKVFPYSLPSVGPGADPGVQVEVCMGMGKTGIPWVPWDSHGNGSKISHGMGMG